MGTKTKTLMISILAALLVAGFAFLGIPLEPAVVEEALEENLSSFQVSDEKTTVVQSAQVLRVVDGDTFVVSQGEGEQSVRIIGIDAPETVFSSSGAECYGDESRAEAERLLTGRSVVLRSDSTQDLFDTYGRQLAYAEVDGVDYGLMMIESGHAKEFTFRNPYELQEEYVSAENRAIAAQRGLWGSCI